MKQYILYLFLMMVLFQSCMDDDQWYDYNSYNEQSTGVFVVNEGNWTYDNASLSYYKPDSMVVLNQVFEHANEAPLGDVAQSMTIRDSLGYVVLNNSGKIYVFNIHTFQFAGKIAGLTSPRYIHFINDSKAYVTDIYGKEITIVNPLTYSITGHIDVDNHSEDFYQHSTEQMVQYKQYIFVNCWSYDNQILVIDSDTDKLVDSIEVSIQPKSMVKDQQGLIWVISDGGFAGNPYGHEAPALSGIDPELRKVVYEYQFSKETSPSDICINSTKDTLYFINGDVYRMAVVGQESPELFIESPYQGSYERGYSALGIDPVSNELYLADAIDNIQAGNVYRYKLSGVAIDTFKAGIIPGDFCFKSGR